MADEICNDLNVAQPLLGGLQKHVTAICAICYTIQASEQHYMVGFPLKRYEEPIE